MAGLTNVAPVGGVRIMYNENAGMVKQNCIFLQKHVLQSLPPKSACPTSAKCYFLLPIIVLQLNQ